MTSHLTWPRQQQHAMALLDTCSYDDCRVLPPLDCWDWASELLFHTLGVGGAGAAAVPAVFPETRKCSAEGLACSRR